MWVVGVITYILLCGFLFFRSFDRNQIELFEFIKVGEYEFFSLYWDNILLCMCYINIIISIVIMDNLLII